MGNRRRSTQTAAGFLFVWKTEVNFSVGKLYTISARILIEVPPPELGQPFCIPFGTAATIDGRISREEWSDADSVRIGLPGGITRQTVVRYKHDGKNLYLAFEGNLESAGQMPELVIDARNDESIGWQQDDWVSCVSNGLCVPRTPQ